MLFGRHLGFRGNFEKALAERDSRALELFNSMEEIKRQAASFMKVKAVSAIFRGRAPQKLAIALSSHRARPSPHRFASAHTFYFQRQNVGEKLSPQRLDDSARER